MMTCTEKWALRAWVERDLTARIDRMKATRADVYRRFDIAWEIGDHAAADALDQLGSRLAAKVETMHDNWPYAD